MKQEHTLKSMLILSQNKLGYINYYTYLYFSLKHLNTMIANVKGIQIQMDADNKDEVLAVLKAINDAIIGLDGEPQVMAVSIDVEFEPDDEVE